MDSEEADYYLNSIKNFHELDPRETKASVRVARRLKANGERIDRVFVCPTCQRQVNSWMGKEFLMDIGECYQCDHVRNEKQDWYDG